MPGGILLPGTAAAADVNSGKTFSSAAGFNLTGTLTQIPNTSHYLGGSTSGPVLWSPNVAMTNQNQWYNIAFGDFGAGTWFFAAMFYNNSVGVTTSISASTASATPIAPQGGSITNADPNVIFCPNVVFTVTTRVYFNAMCPVEGSTACQVLVLYGEL